MRRAREAANRKREQEEALRKFATTFVHQALYHYHCYPRLSFKKGQYHGLTVYSCCDDEVADYISELIESVMEWVEEGRCLRLDLRFTEEQAEPDQKFSQMFDVDEVAAGEPSPAHGPSTPEREMRRLFGEDCPSPPEDCPSPPEDCPSPPEDCPSPPEDCPAPPEDCPSPPHHADVRSSQQYLLDTDTSRPDNTKPLLGRQSGETSPELVHLLSPPLATSPVLHLSQPDSSHVPNFAPPTSSSPTSEECPLSPELLAAEPDSDTTPVVSTSPIPRPDSTPPEDDDAIFSFYGDLSWAEDKPELRTQTPHVVAELTLELTPAERDDSSSTVAWRGALSRTLRDAVSKLLCLPPAPEKHFRCAWEPLIMCDIQETPSQFWEVDLRPENSEVSCDVLASDWLHDYRCQLFLATPLVS